MTLLLMKVVMMIHTLRKLTSLPILMVRTCFTMGPVKLSQPSLASFMVTLLSMPRTQGSELQPHPQGLLGSLQATLSNSSLPLRDNVSSKTSRPTPELPTKINSST